VLSERGGFAQVAGRPELQDGHMNINQAARAIVIRTAVLAGILIAMTLFINLPWFDEELHPDLAQLKVPREVSMEGNAYVLAMGFWADADKDPREVGLQLIDIIRNPEVFRIGNQAQRTTEQKAILRQTAASGAGWVGQFLSLSGNCNVRLELDCADQMIARLATGVIDNPRLQLQIKRFEQMLAQPRYQDIQELESSSPIPNFGYLQRVARIRLAASFNADSTAEFLDRIDQDIRFWKRVLEGGEYLYAKMPALARLRGDAQFMSALMRMRRLGAEELGRIATIMAPLTASERNIGIAFMNENRVNINSDIRFTEALSGIMSPLRVAAQKNATTNEFYLTATLPAQRRAALSAAEFYQQRAHEYLPYQMRVMPPPLYNLGGKVTLNYLQPPDYPDYISRVHDTEGLLALVRLQAEIALSSAGVEEVVKASHERNPYTGEPMNYDPREATLAFTCLAKGANVCKVRINQAIPARR
jgi:hypothetical protein